MKKNKTTHFMSGILILVFVAIFLILTGRFLYIQATGEINGVSLDKWAEEKRTASYTLPAERGKIFDKNGMTLAYDRPTFSIRAIVDETYTTNEEEPQHVKDPEKTAEMLAPLLDVKKSYVLERLNYGIENDLFQVEFGSAGKELSQKKKDKIKKMDLPGIIFDEEAIRYYPNGMFASHILGFARKDEDGHITGVTGMEREMNNLLSGEPGHISYERDKYNTKLLDPNEIIKQPKDGDNVYLTIDQKIQTLLEDVMSQVQKEYKPKRMTAIVMNPKTGEIVAMSNRPSYNPNNPADVQNWYNDAISTPFEPGSTIKMFTWASAIEEGVYNGDEWFESGSYQISNQVKPIRDHNGGEGWGPITYDEGFQRSSNVAAAKLAWEKIGPEKFLDYLKAFDFDQKTGIDLPGEVAGQILYNWPIEKITTAFGQGTTVTPIQQMKAATAIANDGEMVKPYVISKIVDSTTNNVIEESSREVVAKPISKETSDQVMNLLESVVTSEHGTGTEFALDDYSVAGKTGTAQIPDPDGGYLTGHENYVFSFLGMAPADDPKLMMYVSVKQPQLEGYEPGSVPVSFIFKNVMKNSLHYLNINPDKEANEPVETVEIPDLVGKNADSLKQTLKDLGLNVTVIGNGNKIVDASAVQGEALLPNDRILLLTDKPTMPNIIGWSRRDVLQLADLIQLDIETVGNGFAISQSIKEGNAVKKGDYLGVELQVPTSTEEKNTADNKEEENTEESTDQSE